MFLLLLLSKREREREREREGDRKREKESRECFCYCQRERERGEREQECTMLLLAAFLEWYKRDECFCRGHHFWFALLHLYRSIFSIVKMVQIAGKYAFVSQDNFEKYLEAIGKNHVAHFAPNSSFSIVEPSYNLRQRIILYQNWPLQELHLFFDAWFDLR